MALGLALAFPLGGWEGAHPPGCLPSQCSPALSPCSLGLSPDWMGLLGWLTLGSPLAP